MTVTSAVVPLLVFEAADCLMAIPASEIAHLEGSDPLFTDTESRAAFDLGKYFNGRKSDGPWLHWGRGARAAWLRVQWVIDVVPIAVSGMSPMPALLRRDRRTRAFLAAGVRGDDVFLLLDPARLSDMVGRGFSRAGNE
ncbi:MAG TPA: hypothetical protein VM115_08370 [Vicinamibacterales bacterium]|nr:hypothetical protein [Vicinamibacterales bacterium]